MILIWINITTYSTIEITWNSATPPAGTGITLRQVGQVRYACELPPSSVLPSPEICENITLFTIPTCSAWLLPNLISANASAFQTLAQVKRKYTKGRKFWKYLCTKQYYASKGSINLGQFVLKFPTLRQCYSHLLSTKKVNVQFLGER